MRCWLRFFVVIMLGSAPLTTSAAERPGAADSAAFVRALISAADQTSFAELQLAIDKAVDPATDLDAARAELDSMVAKVKRMLATIPTEAASTDAGKFEVLRDFLYRSGWWNDDRPFGYDLDDPLGQKNFYSRLLTRYVETRRGNCVSMPILFLVLGERLGLNVTLSTAPLHVFVKWTDDAGRTFNFEATSGTFARDSHIRKEMAMTDEAIANGVYMKTLTRTEAAAVMATTIMDHLLETGKYDDAIAVADTLLEAYPTYAYLLVKKGTAYHRMLQAVVVRKHGSLSEVPIHLVPYANFLNRANLDAFTKAEALGWREPELK